MNIPTPIQKQLDKLGIETLRPSQEKSIKAGLFNRKNLLVCTPTASGKTLVGEMALIHSLTGNSGQRSEKKEESRGRERKSSGQETKSGEQEIKRNTHITSPICIYVVPLRALASEKYKEFKKRYPKYNIALTSGDMDSDDRYLENYDIIITTSEKLDSLMRHHSPWLSRVDVVVIDEIHLLNDPSRGPTLEIAITALKNKEHQPQLIGLSATIGNAKELANWLEAELVEDAWRPTRLDKGIYLEGDIYFPEKEEEE